MLNKKIEAAQLVATKLNEFEKALDIAIMKGGELVSAQPAARLKAKLAASVGQEGIAKTGAAIAALYAARATIVEAHAAFEVTGKDLGVSPAMTGGGWKTDPVGQVSEPATDLRSVA